MSAPARAASLLALLTAVLAAPVPCRSQDSREVVVREEGTASAAAAVLRGALGAPHDLATGTASGRVLLPRGSTWRRTIVVIGGATIAGRVLGEVIAVGGDAFVEPGAVVDGRVVAIGGGVYVSALASVHGGTVSFRDETFTSTQGPGGTLLLEHRWIEAPERARPLALQGVLGFQIPSYDRVDGLSLPWGSEASVLGGRLEATATVMYRSNLGALDPSVRVGFHSTSRLLAEAMAGRATETNDAWSRSELANGVLVLYSGYDERNYYRADRAEGRLAYTSGAPAAPFTAQVGALDERAWSTGPDALTRAAPWSLLDRRDRHSGMLRPNQPILRGTITSVFGGAGGHWLAQSVAVNALARVEVPWHTPDNRRFVQTTLDGDVAFPTFGSQRFEAAGHAVVTSGDGAPPQRFAYLGGSATLPTLPLLGLGGDELLYIDARYMVPIDRLTLPLVGPPALGLRYAAGTAGLRHALPHVTENVGVRLAVSLLTFDVLVDPSSRAVVGVLGLATSR